MINFEVTQKSQSIASIKVIGVGGAGGNTVNSIIDSGYNGIECIAVNTDLQALECSKAHHKIQIGIKSTKGLGAGASPELGKRAAEEDLERIMDIVADADIVFLAAGMGGGTGSGALPIIAKALREKGILTIVVVTKPFDFEGKRRARLAQEALNNLKSVVDTLIIIPNQKLLNFVDQEVSMIDAFALINDILCQSVRGISDIITKPGHINVDFADVCAVMKNKGLAVMGTAKATGEDRAKDATLKAIASPLLENMTVQGASGVLLNITGGKNVRLHEIRQAASIIYEQAHEDATIILGSVIDEQLNDEIIVTIIATGFSLEDSDLLEKTKAMETVQIRGTVVDRSENIFVKDETTTTKALEKENYGIEKEYQEIKEVHHRDVYTELLSQEMQDKQNLTHDSYDDLDIPTFLRKETKKEMAD